MPTAEPPIDIFLPISEQDKLSIPFRQQFLFPPGISPTVNDQNFTLEIKLLGTKGVEIKLNEINGVPTNTIPQTKGAEKQCGNGIK